MKEYPKDRQRTGFAIRYVKALMRSDAAREIGIEAVHLCIFVASREDQLHYKKAPAFWRSELLHRLGKGSPKALLRIRQTAIDAGLLHHEPGTRTTPSKYWVLVPEWLQPHFDWFRKRNLKESDAFRKRNGKEATRSENGTESGTESGTLSNTHIPDTERGARKRFKPPTVQEVKAYVQDQSLKVDPSKFCDYYASVGWTIGKGKAMRDWKAALRNWSRSEQKEPQEPALKPLKPMRRIHQ